MTPELRALFPVTQSHVYLNHAAVAPISQPVFERMQEYTRDLLEHGLVHFREWGEAVARVRKLAARFINAEPDEIAFAPNTSSGLAYVANGIDWQAGDNIVSADCEFPANSVPWRRVCREFGVELRLAHERDGRLETEEILSLIDSRTRVVALSFVEFASGFRNDLAAIGRHCRERGVLFVVDAIQGLGALRLDVEACCIDALSADAHKFLLGPDGVALFYVSRAAMERIKPTVTGWMSVARPFDFDPEQPYADGARRFEAGALNTAGVVGLGAAIELFQQTGLERIESHLLELGDHLCEGLLNKGYQLVSSRRASEKSAVICCRHEKFSANDLYQILNARRIITTPRLGRLRISPHFYNTREDIDELIRSLPV
ncbi:MAG TPA: aminotransferase class V-fold PLP-dependent enzyme [Blastocatellia bacterium]|nr:aminotransferase class V-fold PLP-dependent enzyme [Blastocatellia bacterium]HMV82765.1 aminotransferase class V-fold PLP-dependent enzyme [Blastocatellia bacterium]HMX26414.1 aminotransferase class V-fold PLP-dependent enzyme [Blastocatellia bacterium]HMY73365.1 aminotransferase class V-fold PLP-dependent enzyme [Blastocatellia bacterium]HMZ20281.1 aminotransferase class V-fold PLP-dependent enzyme [Blastocatellia bacterium]